MAERPPNARTADRTSTERTNSERAGTERANTERTYAERTHNSRRHRAETRPDESSTAASRAYQGSHRAERMHRADDDLNGALQRSSRVGRHHADRSETDRSNRR